MSPNFKELNGKFVGPDGEDLEAAIMGLLEAWDNQPGLPIYDPTGMVAIGADGQEIPLSLESVYAAIVEGDFNPAMVEADGLNGPIRIRVDSMSMQGTWEASHYGASESPQAPPPELPGESPELPEESPELPEEEPELPEESPELPEEEPELPEEEPAPPGEPPEEPPGEPYDYGLPDDYPEEKPTGAPDVPVIPVEKAAAERRRITDIMRGRISRTQRAMRAKIVGLEQESARQKETIEAQKEEIGALEKAVKWLGSMFGR